MQTVFEINIQCVSQEIITADRKLSPKLIRATWPGAKLKCQVDTPQWGEGNKTQGVQASAPSTECSGPSRKPHNFQVHQRWADGLNCGAVRAWDL